MRSKARFALLFSFPVVGGCLLMQALPTPTSPSIRPTIRNLSSQKESASIHDQLEILQRAAEEKGRGELFAQALDKVGPWAKNQRLSDNDSPPKRI
eukprot:CAMPEP_0114237842 /NCGR_PEP_ID=MMETSP0058-20121206/7607_1 /TAXON_ID=36894 /ORGANISM="Pyramimonas parkeae, CCMP726" /LENGTH=95 /DNA_ID=CAMNT_0001349913 /DNA_START=104 /DNA_END=391 /DNA_ORIENTATION=-